LPAPDVDRAGPTAEVADFLVVHAGGTQAMLITKGRLHAQPAPAATVGHAWLACGDGAVGSDRHHLRDIALGRIADPLTVGTAPQLLDVLVV
jgi:hypothetical protein